VSESASVRLNARYIYIYVCVCGVVVMNVPVYLSNVCTPVVYACRVVLGGMVRKDQIWFQDGTKCTLVSVEEFLLQRLQQHILHKVFESIATALKATVVKNDTFSIRIFDHGWGPNALL
jgi:hypothetical protein